PQNHDRMAAEIIRPFVREECAWVVEHHGLFQTYYYGHHYGWDRNARDKFKGHPHYQACADFCERWDQASFDPGYGSESLEHFAPMVREVFARKAYHPDVMQDGVVKGLPQL
ncbi:MAG: peptidase, partial [Pseudomonadota bacterium]